MARDGAGRYHHQVLAFRRQHAYSKNHAASVDNKTLQTEAVK